MKNKFCQNCGAKIDEKVEICPKCGVRVKDPVKKKEPALAAVLIGAGQMYNGEVRKGFLLLFGAVISWFLMFVVIGFFTYFMILIYSVYDAYKTAEKMN